MRTRRSRILFAAISAALSAFQPAWAQERPVGAELWGRVFQAGDTLALPGALIEVMGEARSSTTSRAGLYRLVGLAPGPHMLRVRLLGYHSVTLEVDVEEGRTDRRDFPLERQATTLPEVRIEGRLRRVPPRYDDVYRRMTTANGKFFTREDIESQNPQDVQSLLQQVPTARVTNRGIVQFAKCDEGGASLFSSGRRTTGVQVYIDGYRMTGRIRNGGFDPNFSEQREVLRLVIPSQIQAIEVYTGVSRIPGVFLDDACAVIAIWTRSY